MALEKEIVLDNGIVTNYHRIVSITNIINEQTLLEVASYTSEEMREKEKEELEKARAETPEGEEPYEMNMNVFIATNYFPTEYNGDITIESAYEEIKEIPEFSDAKDA